MIVEMAASQIILSMLMLGFGISGMVAGGISIYFGSKKNRTIGAILIAIGAVIFILCLVFYGGPASLENPFWALIVTIIVVAIGAGIGVAIIGIVFLLAVLR
jgi:hypothetical protein